MDANHKGHPKTDPTFPQLYVGRQADERRVNGSLGVGRRCVVEDAAGDDAWRESLKCYPPGTCPSCPFLCLPLPPAIANDDDIIGPANPVGRLNPLRTTTGERSLGYQGTGMGGEPGGELDSVAASITRRILPQIWSLPGADRNVSGAERRSPTPGFISIFF